MEKYINNTDHRYRMQLNYNFTHMINNRFQNQLCQYNRKPNSYMFSDKRMDGVFNRLNRIMNTLEIRGDDAHTLTSLIILSDMFEYGYLSAGVAVKNICMHYYTFIYSR